MSEPIRMTLPANREKLAELRIGQEVRLTGAVFTSRDAGHERMLAALRETGELPFGLAGETIFYAGPTPPAAGRPLGSVGPTTASRMDFATPELMDAGLAACIGKGKIGLDAMRRVATQPLRLLRGRRRHSGAAREARHRKRNRRLG